MRVGYDIPDESVVGNDRDDHEAYRNLSYVAVWEPGNMSGDPA
jgi:hypoxanthine-guanine phosphoribosyltransferase